MFANDPVLNDMGQTLFSCMSLPVSKTLQALSCWIVSNHVIADGWSLNLFSASLMQLYLGEDKPVSLCKIACGVKYAEFAVQMSKG
ncbi:hypothetical protein KCP76_26435 (plasmid) [Salmonella enterica subsp. enterica serovar Weltevreden]|nr:hypothetical protein KCP76_26435 [Salmonella enterica subsp. enterica serovar Weltevreden]QUI99498.1 hypothetical protein KCP74_25855 [Salmonella enterica subsp. enterica]